MLIAFELAQLLKRHDFSVLGPFANTDDALAELDQTLPDAAILDINLGNGATSEPLASELMDRSLPFVFLTGYGSGASMPSKFDSVQKITKTCTTPRVDRLGSILNCALKARV